jgi:hypothetical protein
MNGVVQAMPATLFDECDEAKPKAPKPLSSHQLIQRYHSLLIDRLEEATSYDGALFNKLSCDTYGVLLAVIDPVNFGRDNWKRGVSLTAEDFGKDD